MKIRIILYIGFFTYAMISKSSAQTNNIIGIYYLTGVMETASGIKLNADSTFEFFFSQGALDRTGEGTWTIRNGEVVLQSDPSLNRGLELIESNFSEDKGSSVEIIAENQMLLSFIHVSINGTNQTDFIDLDESGRAKFDKKIHDHLYVYFELCPEKIHQIEPVHEEDNVLKVAVLPEIFNVSFENIVLKPDNGLLKGQHPLLNGSDYIYEKN